MPFHQVYSVQRFSLKLLDSLTLYMQLTMFSCSCLKVPMLFRCSQHNSLFACGSKLVCGSLPFSVNSKNTCYTAARKTDRALHFNLWKQHTNVSMVQWSCLLPEYQVRTSTYMRPSGSANLFVTTSASTRSDEKGNQCREKLRTRVNPVLLVHTGSEVLTNLSRLMFVLFRHKTFPTH